MPSVLTVLQKVLGILLLGIFSLNLSGKEVHIYQLNRLSLILLEFMAPKPGSGGGGIPIPYTSYETSKCLQNLEEVEVPFLNIMNESQFYYLEVVEDHQILEEAVGVEDLHLQSLLHSYNNKR